MLITRFGGCLRKCLIALLMMTMAGCDTGAQGPAGAQGPKGAQGATGPQGLKAPKAPGERPGRVSLRLVRRRLRRSAFQAVLPMIGCQKLSGPRSSSTI